MKTLILGGARSGKSRHAEYLAESSDPRLHYVATAQALDQEMEDRINAHQARRSNRWMLHETPIHLSKTLDGVMSPGHLAVVDCLTLWITNCLIKQCWQEQRKLLLDQFDTWAGDLILVSNETGSGIVPSGELTRSFVDESGFLHQELARRCDSVILTVAGIPIDIKSPTKS